MDADLHPRPQFTRSRWTDLSGPWGFAHDDADEGLDAGWHEDPKPFDRTIQVPFPPESAASGIGDTGFHPVIWYRRTFRAPHAPGERLLLHFGAVDYRASVWVDGRLVATHEGGHTPFHADVTTALDGDLDEHVLTVRAEDPPADPTQPRGKQDWMPEPHAIWYERTSGIWQTVWLEPVPAIRIASLCWTPDVERGVLRLCAGVTGPSAAPDADAGVGGGAGIGRLRLAVRLSMHGEVVVDDSYAVSAGTPSTPVNVERDVALDSLRSTFHREDYLWSPEHPNLLQATVRLVRELPSGATEVLDEVGSYAGLRSVSVGAGRVNLNGRPYMLRMVLAQNYWPQSHLAAPSPQALRREVELVKELGFNGVRLHQKVEDPRFLYWCDRLGLVVWGEMPSPLTYSPRTLQRLTAEWLEVLERDASCPSLIAWVPFNESWGVPGIAFDPAQRHAVRALYHLTKAFDPTRLVIGNDGWEQVASDLIGVHDYTASGRLLTERYGSAEAMERTLTTAQPGHRSIVLADLVRAGEPVMVTEFGGTTFDPEAKDSWNGYGDAESPEILLARYIELVEALLASPVVAGYCWTQLTDAGKERNGLLYADRRPKLDVAVVRATNQRVSAAVPADAIPAAAQGTDGVARLSDQVG